ncbi:uncharacterized protein J4E84_007258 [Alternaria hordeiaustralica]|uniref:uncharacterized protein n=1 Tax=Alternaria hordeiaustralica TaxID=1187925 RepID=UPI0020C2B91A|nr:uncharacterized protein J4E84_007258 [Alternaria hordeiaustralica]KAI4682793.1 hypothetical protein J4E84_007258 [Alternaria hordeiaustralica]
MKLSNVLSMALASTTGAKSIGKPNEVDSLAAESLHRMQTYYSENPLPSPGTCTLDNVAVRRDWSALSKQERRSYIKAVKCLAKLPAKTPAAIASGAKSRYDDIVVTHIQQAFTIHGTANFLTWHRYYTWAFEQMLRNECGYKGYQPYYNWDQWADNPKASPFFDGSDTSMSGDGAYIANRTSVCFPSIEQCYIQLQPGSGGGCVTSGPFKDWTINLGPLAAVSLPPPTPNPQPNGLGYNPRCLSRDISLQSSAETRDSVVAALIKDNTTITSFQTVLGGEFAQGKMGPHVGGHNTIGGDAGSDFINSPADPAFFAHHAMVDRVYWTWQNLDLEARKEAIAGGTSGVGDGGEPGTLEDVITLGEWVGVGNVTIRGAMSTVGGPLCYVYA